MHYLRFKLAPAPAQMLGRLTAIAFAVLCVSFSACGRPAPRAMNVMPDKACDDAKGSYYLQRIGEHVLAVDTMTPTLLSTRAEAALEHCPDNLDLRGGDKACTRLLDGYLCALGPLDFGRSADAGTIANTAARRIFDHWQALRGTITAASDKAPARMLVKHYPHPSAPGDCVTVQVAFYNIPDPHFDMDAFRHPAVVDRPISGTVVTLRKTYQLDPDSPAADGAPRLVEAAIEVAHDQRMGVASLDRSELLRATGMADDGEREAHFEDVGGGTHWGLAWVDGSYGKGEPRPWSGAYRLSGEGLLTSTLPESWIDGLRAIMDRL